MGRVVVLESSRDANGNRVNIDGPTFDAICRLARLNGFPLANEAVLSQIDAQSFAEALEQGLARGKENRPAPNRLRRGSERFTLAEETKVPEKMLRDVVALSRQGGIVITRRAR